jgi:hypothetical protein
MRLGYYVTQKQNDNQCTRSHQTLPGQKKGRMSCSKFKALLSVFCDILGVVMAEWVPNGQTVNQHYYIEILTKLFE